MVRELASSPLTTPASDRSSYVTQSQLDSILGAVRSEYENQQKKAEKKWQMRVKQTENQWRQRMEEQDERNKRLIQELRDIVTEKSAEIELYRKEVKRMNQKLWDSMADKDKEITKLERERDAALREYERMKQECAAGKDREIALRKKIEELTTNISVEEGVQVV